MEWSYIAEPETEKWVARDIRADGAWRSERGISRPGPDELARLCVRSLRQYDYLHSVVEAVEE